MKKRHLTQLLTLCAGFILLSAVIPVNPASLCPSQQGTTAVVDGVPLPLPDPPPPKGILASSFDGVPLPLPEPAPKKIA
jgi:hypothetical protein